MEIHELGFYYDLPSRLFSRIELSALIDIPDECSIDDKKHRLLQEFRKLETYFDERFLTNGYCKKETIGSESEYHINAGFSYGIKKLRGIQCQFSCKFWRGELASQKPVIVIVLEAPDNYNYWVLEHMLGSLPWRLTPRVKDHLARLRGKMSARSQDLSSVQFLEQFKSDDTATEDERNRGNKMTDDASGEHYFAEADSMLSGTWEAFLKSVAKRRW